MDSAALIRDARRRAGLSQTELAARSGTSQPAISAYERGAKVPSADTLGRVLAASGARLATVPGRRVRTPGPAILRRAGRRLGDVLALAAELPTRHRPTLTFPRLPSASGQSDPP